MGGKTVKAMREQAERGNLLFPFQHYKMTNEGGNLFIPYHWHEEIEILYCICGTVTLQLNGSSHLLKQGDICFINREELHQFYSADSSMYYYAYVFPMERLCFSQQDYCQVKFIQPMLDMARLFPTRLPADTACYATVRQEMENIIRVNEEKSTAYQLMTKASLLKIIAALAQEGLFCDASLKPAEDYGEDAHRIRRITDWMKLHLAERMTLDMAADFFHTSPKYFSRYFKKLFQKNFSEYLNLLRIETACMLLLTTTDSISDIACRCGYDNTSYFIRKFKEQTGKTPFHYRKE